MASGNFDERTLEHLAALTRLDLEGREKDGLLSDIKKILEYVETMKQADTTGVAPLSGGSFLNNALRADGDGACEAGEKERAIKQFPKSRGGFLEVPPVFE